MERPRFVVTTFPLLSLHHAEPRGFGRFVRLEAVSLGVWRVLGIAYGFGGEAGSFEADARSAASTYSSHPLSCDPVVLSPALVETGQLFSLVARFKPRLDGSLRKAWRACSPQTRTLPVGFRYVLRSVLLAQNFF